MTSPGFNDSDAIDKNSAPDGAEPSDQIYPGEDENKPGHKWLYGDPPDNVIDMLIKVYEMSIKLKHTRYDDDRKPGND